MPGLRRRPPRRGVPLLALARSDPARSLPDGDHPAPRPPRRSGRHARAGREGRSSRAHPPTAAVPRRDRSRLPDPGPPHADAQRRGNGEGQPDDLSRYVDGRYPVRAGRAVGRSASAGHRPAGRHPARADRPGEHGRRRRARRADHAGGRPHHRDRSRTGSPRGADCLRGHTRADPPLDPRSHGRVSVGPALPARAHRTPPGGNGPAPEGRLRAALHLRRDQAQPRRGRSPPPPRAIRLRQRGLRIGEIDTPPPGHPRQPAPVARRARRGSGPGAGYRREHPGRRGRPRRSVLARQDPALESGFADRRVGGVPQGARRDRRGGRRRNDSGHVLLQRGRRALRSLPGARLRTGRDAVSLRHLPALSGLRGAPVQAGGSGHPAGRVLGR